MAGAPLPQPLAYLITDIGRRHGIVTVVAALCCLRSEDTSLLREMCSDRSLKRLGLQMIAPTAAISGQGTDNTLAALRAAGYLPATQDVTTEVAAGKSGPPVIDLARVRADHDAAVEQLQRLSAESRAREPSARGTRRRARAMAEALRSGRSANW